MCAALLASGDHVAPRMDGSEYAVLASVGHGNVLNAYVVDVHGLHEPDFDDLLQRHHVQTVICGEISAKEQQRLERCGIAVIAGVCGSVCSVLFAHAAGTLKPGVPPSFPTRS